MPAINTRDVSHTKEKVDYGNMEKSLDLLETFLEDKDNMSDPFFSKLSRAIEDVFHLIQHFGADRVFCAFNGGKDAAVVLLIFLYARRLFEYPMMGAKLLFFEDVDEFEEIKDYVYGLSESINAELISLKNPSMTLSFNAFHHGPGMSEVILNEVSHGERLETSPYSVIMGTRRGDPWTEKAETFSLTDGNYPKFTRAQVLLGKGGEARDFSYGDVWTFLTRFEVAYCPLYDEGYTSIGGVSSTHRNPFLKLSDGSYSPAKNLAADHWHDERAGRYKIAQPGAMLNIALGEGVKDIQAPNTYR